jgi:alkylation response protein AidB-like acyl-CoA dehydrogenase
MLGQEQEDLKKQAIEFAKQNLNYDIIKNDYESVFNKDAWMKCAQYGVQGWLVPKSYGGKDLGVLNTVCSMQGLGYACLDDGLLFGISAHLFACTMPILHFGTKKQKEQYIPSMCSGEIIASHSATEPKSGSDIYSLVTTAEKKGAKYVLNGEKHYVTNGAAADIFIVFATTNPSLKEKGISAFIIHKDNPGLITSKVIETMGNRTAGIVRLRLENCEIDESQLLGSEGIGSLIFTGSMELERGFILSRSIGVMERLLEKSLKYAKTHKQFGQPIGKFQYISGKLVEMKMDLENAKNLIYNLAKKKDDNKTVVMDAALVNLYVSEAWVRCSLNAIEIYGGNGYTTENEIEREVRNAIGSKFYSGTTEMQKIVIAKFMGL